MSREEAGTQEASTAPAPALFSAPPLARVCSSLPETWQTDNCALPRRAQKSLSSTRGPEASDYIHTVLSPSKHHTWSIDTDYINWRCTHTQPHLTIIQIPLQRQNRDATQSSLSRILLFQHTTPSSSLHPYTPESHSLHRNSPPFRRNLLIFKEKKAI